MPVTAPPFLGPAESLRAIVQGLGQAVSLRGILAFFLTLLIRHKINRIAEAFAELAGQIHAGTHTPLTPAAQPEQQPESPKPRQTVRGRPAAPAQRDRLRSRLRPTPRKWRQSPKPPPAPAGDCQGPSAGWCDPLRPEPRKMAGNKPAPLHVHFVSI